MPVYIIATSACRCIDYIQQQCVCVFVPFILAISPSDQGETWHFAVYLEDYIHLFSVFFCSNSRTNRGHTGGGNTAVHKKIGVLVREVKNGVKW